ncbi:MAG: hypothetical protein Q4D19_13875 [Lautropia sp.]|nr:hypothetical protein [Lautropia sp.]
MNHSLTFHLSLALVALSGLTLLPDAQAATPRSEIARPTDFLPQTADAGAAVCKSPQLMTCGRQAASRLKPPVGSAPKASYRFAEEQFLFDSGVGIFLQTAVAATKGANAPMEWRRRLAFRRTPDGRFQLVQIGIQYRCGSGSWQKTACAPRAVARAAAAKASGQAAGAATAGAGASSAGGAGGDSVGGAARSPGAQAAGASAAGVAGAATGAAPQASGTPAPGGSATATPPAGTPGGVSPVDATDPRLQGDAAGMPDGAGSEEKQRLDARWRPMRDDIRTESSSPEDEARARAAAALGMTGEQPGSQGANPAAGRAGAAAGRPATSPDGATGTGANTSGGAPADAGRAGRAVQQGVSPAGHERTGAAAGRNGNAASGSRHADIVAARPSLSEDQLRSQRGGEASATHAPAAAGGNAVKAPGAGVPGQAGEAADAMPIPDATPAGTGGAGGAGAAARPGAGAAPSGMPQQPAGGMAGGAVAGVDADGVGTPGEAPVTPRPDPVRGDLRLQPTTPDAVRNARGFSPLVPGTEKIARMSQLCEQPIDMCGKTVFDELFKPETFDELLPVQVQRERFIYADGPVVSAVYLVTTVNLPDAVLAAERIRIEFVRRGSGWVAVAAGRQVRCRRGNDTIGNWADAHCG